MLNLKGNVFWLFILIFTVPLSAKDFAKYFTDCQSIYGGTGQIVLPTTKVVLPRHYALGIHRFAVSGSYGIFQDNEVGFYYDLMALSPTRKIDLAAQLTPLQFQIKYQILKGDSVPFELTTGVHGPQVYVVGGKSLPFSLTSQIGIFFRTINQELRLDPFISLAYLMRYSLFMVDFDATHDELSLGWRFLLSPQIKFDLFILNVFRIGNIFFDNLVFGLTFSV